jgi:RAB protein geranylgeranyltransferase component A
MTTNLVSHGELVSSQKEEAGQSAVLPNNVDVDVDVVDNCEKNDTEPQHDDNDTSAPEDRPERPKLDEEGLALEYDVAICGTGLVQSILASALARAGKSVLHCDGADYYGELDAVWNLPMIEKFLERKDNENDAGGNASGEGCQDDDDDDDDDDANAAKDTVLLAPDGGRSSLRWHRSYCSSSLPLKSEEINFGIRVGTNVKTPFGDGRVRSIRRPSQNDNDNDQQNGPTSPSSIAVQIELHKWNLADGRSPIVYINLDDLDFDKADTNKSTDDDNREECCGDAILLADVLCRSRNIRSMQSVQAETILKQCARSLALDATPSFILATGRAVQGMLASGVADYLEFKPVNGLYWLDKTKPTVSNKTRNKKINKSMNATKENDDEDTVLLSRVPCSKNDVFGTKLLAPMEKRRFMKFIQLSMDYATKVSVEEEIRQENTDGEDDQVESQEEIHALNERHLNQGRSLSRPQNKAVDTGELQILQEFIENESMTFDEFLTQKYKLSPKLRAIVRYALAWEIDDSSTTLAKGMTTLRKHLQALGRYGATAFLVPMYGSGELSQAFCRSAAVFGATYLLRRAPFAIKVENFNDNCDVDTSCERKNNAKERVSGIVLSSDTVVDEYNTKENLQQQQQPNSRTKTIKCSQVILPVKAMGAKYLPSNGRMANGLRRRIMRRISVFSGKIIQSENGEQRHVIFFPPQTVGNDHAIHGILLDSSVSVAPRGCTVLHLTTTIMEEADDDKNTEGKNADSAEILEQAQAAVLKSKVTTTSSEDPPMEIYHVSFSHECPDLEVARTASYPTGIHLCSHTAQVLTADTAFEQAEKIFSSICPGEKFLGLSSVIDKVIRERVEEKRYDDDEKNMLDSAIGMIGHAPSESST